MVGSLHDITERKSAEAALRASEAQLRVITDNVPQLICYIDKDERYRFANRAQEEWHGLSKDEIVGKTIRELLGEDEYKAIKPKIDRALLGDWVDSEDLHYSPLKGECIIHTTRVPHFSDDGEVLGYFLAIDDITERKKVENALRESAAQLKLITDNVPAVIVYVDKDERFRFANKVQDDWLGYASQRTLGKTVREVVGEAHYAKIKPGIDRTLQDGEVIEEEQEFDHEEHGRQIKRTTRVPHISNDGEILGYFAVIEDITERRRADQALRDNEAQLRLVTDNVPAIIIYVDTDRIVRFANKSRRDWFGETVEKVAALTSRIS